MKYRDCEISNLKGQVKSVKIWDLDTSGGKQKWEIKQNNNRNGGADSW